MTLFDFFTIGVLLTSGVVGLVRGATREVTTVIALLLAAVLSVFSLRFTDPIARTLVHTGWMADTAAVLAVFILSYIALRLLGGMATRSVRATPLSGLDRLLGFGIGVVRGLVAVGAVTLLITAATPTDRVPGWMTRARTYPLADAAGRGLKTFAPKGLKLAKAAVPVMGEAVSGEHRGNTISDHNSSAEDTP